MRLSPLFCKDAYKIGHVAQYPPGTEYVYSNFTARGSRDPAVGHVVVFGIQYLVYEYFVTRMQDDFFDQPAWEVVPEYHAAVSTMLGIDIDVGHIDWLHDLGYLPLEVKALPEGTLCPLGVPFLTIANTDARGYWLPNFFETLISCTIWGPMTSATTAHKFRKLLDTYADWTEGDSEFVPFQAHDFAMRGMIGVEAAALSGAGHLLSFTGSDNIPAIKFIEQYYHEEPDQDIFLGGSIPATEHSVMCVDGEAGEIDTFRRLITEVYPHGMVAAVSDSWDYWRVVNEYLPKLKDEIMARNGKLVIRPDSGDPVDIILKTIPKLWDIFGGTKTNMGYKVLDSHIGLIYGDSINYERAQEILSGLKVRGFASTNVVLGLGSYTYQFTTRDQYNMAMKATYAVVNGSPREIFKDPKTDDGTKRSAKGLLHVSEDLVLTEQATLDQERNSALQRVFYNGATGPHTSYSEIRERLEVARGRKEVIQPKVA